MMSLMGYITNKAILFQAMSRKGQRDGSVVFVSARSPCCTTFLKWNRKVHKIMYLGFLFLWSLWNNIQSVISSVLFVASNQPRVILCGYIQFPLSPSLPCFSFSCQSPFPEALVKKKQMEKGREMVLLSRDKFFNLSGLKVKNKLGLNSLLCN